MNIEDPNKIIELARAIQLCKDSGYDVTARKSASPAEQSTIITAKMSRLPKVVKRGAPPVYPFGNMEVGVETLFKRGTRGTELNARGTSPIQNAAYSYGRNHGKTFECRQSPSGVWITRTS